MSMRRPLPMIALGYGKYVRADRIVMLEPLSGDEGRGGGSRTRVWIEGVLEPVIASRTERAILEEMEGVQRPSRRRVRSGELEQPGLF